jgi:hypothetical protein
MPSVMPVRGARDQSHPNDVLPYEPAELGESTDIGIEFPVSTQSRASIVARLRHAIGVSRGAVEKPFVARAPLQRASDRPPSA